MMRTTMNKTISVFISIIMLLMMIPGTGLTVNAAYENTHINTGDQREDIVGVAKTQIGYHEGSLDGTTNGSDNYTKYNVDLYAINGSYNYAWCQSFVSWCAKQAGIPASTVPRTAGTITAKDTFIDNGVYHAGPYEGGSYVPSAGDIIYFYSSSTESKHHVGIVSACDGNTVYTIEGNSGNAVTEHSYSVSNGKIRGYAVPFGGGMVIPELSFSKSSYVAGETVDMSWKASPEGSGLEHYWLIIDAPSGRILNETMNRNTSYSFTANEVGTYTITAFATPYNSPNGEGSLTDTKTITVSEAIPKGKELASGAGQTIPDGDYYIFSAIDPNYYLDVSGRECPAANGTNVEMYISATGYPNPYDAWTVEYLNNGFYKIKQKGTSMCLDVNGAYLDRGTNVQAWAENTTTAQQWSIVRTDTGYKIQSRCNSFYLDVNGAAFQAGTNVQVWEGNETAAQRFCFVPYGPSVGQTIEDGTYTIASAVNNSYGFDVQGYDNTSYTDGTNVQLWEIQDGNDQFDVKYLGNGYYSICESISGLSLDVNNENPAEYLSVNKNIQMYTYSDTRNQRWIIREAGDGYYHIISANSGYYVDLNGGIAEPRRNIASTHTTHQMFRNGNLKHLFPRRCKANWQGIKQRHLSAR